MKKIQPNTIVNIQAYKHNGILYRQWNGVKVLKIFPNFIILFMYKTKVEEITGQKWIIREPTFWYMSSSEWFNATGLVRNIGTHFYINLASPYIFEDKTIKFIDYDLDIKAYPGRKVKIVDKKEWETHKKEFNYPLSIIDKIEQATSKVITLIKQNKQFFNEKKINTYIQELINNHNLSKRIFKEKPKERSD